MGDDDFSVAVYLAGDGDTEDGNEQQLISAVNNNGFSHPTKLSEGLEAGGTILLEITGTV